MTQEKRQEQPRFMSKEGAWHLHPPWLTSRSLSGPQATTLSMNLGYRDRRGVFGVGTLSSEVARLASHEPKEQGPANLTENQAP